ncbi:MAG: SDR family oxidoreductase [Rubrivivax sp.]
MNSKTNAPLRVLVVGAGSAIAAAVARRYAARGARLCLAARDPRQLEDAAADLRVRGAAQVEQARFEALDTASHAAFVAAAWELWQGFDVALVAHGVLPDQAAAQRSAAQALESFDVNARSMVSVLTELANRFEQQGSGVLAAVSSPAGDRGRASNYVYGAAKAVVTNFCSGLRHRLHARGVRVVTVLPGFVDTPMTAAFRKGPLWARPEKVARDIERALDRANGEVYTPGFWRWIMLVVRHLPNALFLRSKL